MATGPADKGLDTFKDLVFDPLVNGAISKLLARAAWLSWGPVAFIVTQVVTLVANFLYKEFRELVNIGTIKLMNAEHQMAYEKASVAEYMAYKSKGLDSPEFRKAREQNKKDLAKFVHWTVSNSVQ